MSKELIQAITEMDEENALQLAKQMLADWVEPLEILDACRQAMDIIGKQFETGEVFIPESILAGEMLDKSPRW